MLKQFAILLALSSTSWAQTTLSGELFLSHAKYVAPSQVYHHGDDQATTLGIGGGLILNPSNALRLRLEKSISVPSVPSYANAPQSGSKRTYDFMGASFAYIHWFNSETTGGFFIGPSLSLNHVKRDVYTDGSTTKEASNSLNVDFIAGYQIGKHVAIELHAGLPYASASIAYRF